MSAARETVYDRIGGLLFCGLGIGMYYLSTKLRAWTLTPLGPAFYPKIVGGLMAVLGIALFLSSLSARQGKGDERGFGIPFGTLALPLGILVAYLWSMQYIGYFPSTFAFICLSVWALGGRNMRSLLTGALVSVGGCALVWLVFQKLLYTWLPAGSLFGF